MKWYYDKQVKAQYTCTPPLEYNSIDGVHDERSGLKKIIYSRTEKRNFNLKFNL
jgi:hypothetical protein